MPDTTTDWLAGVVPSEPTTLLQNPPSSDGTADPERQTPQEDAQEPVQEPVRPDQGDPGEPGQAGAVAVIAHFFGMSAEDRADRIARGNGRNWWMRWMAEQPASVESHLHYFLHERYKRRDGRKGWGLDTASPLLNEVFAALYRAYGLTAGLLFGCLLPYASAWIHQRPGRALFGLAVRALIWWNVVAWLQAAAGKN